MTKRDFEAKAPKVKEALPEAILVEIPATEESEA
jgi:hypothetical protein